MALTGVAMGIDVVAFRPTPSAVAELTDALEGQRVDREAIDLYHHLRRIERAHGVQTKVGDDDDDDHDNDDDDDDDDGDLIPAVFSRILSRISLGSDVNAVLPFLFVLLVQRWLKSQCFHDPFE